MHEVLNLSAEELPDGTYCTVCHKFVEYVALNWGVSDYQVTDFVHNVILLGEFYVGSSVTGSCVFTFDWYQ